MNARRRLRSRLAAAAIAAVAASTTAIAVAGGASPGDVTLAGALTDDRPITFTPASVAWEGSELSQRAATLAQRVPLPTGGNFNGIRWNDLHTATDDDINFILQFNAACQWLRAAADQRDTKDASAIWKLIPTWPAMQRGGNGDMFLAALGQLWAAGTSEEPVALTACRESHERETLYATDHDRTPPA